MQHFRVRAFRIAATATMLFAVVLPAAAQLGTAPGKFVDAEKFTTKIAERVMKRSCCCMTASCIPPFGMMFGQLSAKISMLFVMIAEVLGDRQRPQAGTRKPTTYLRC
jgi:hypothetical protein